MSSQKYGNERFWCFIEDNQPYGKEVAVWKGPSDQGEIICRASNKYEAKSIVDALLNYSPVEDKSKFSNKELAFLDFVAANCIEPYSTMASNSIIWNDKETYNKLKNDFPLIYS